MSISSSHFEWLHFVDKNFYVVFINKILACLFILRVVLLSFFIHSMFIGTQNCWSCCCILVVEALFNILTACSSIINSSLWFFFFNPINTGPFGGSSEPGGGLIRAPFHNFSISYAFALKLVTGVHQRLVNTLVQKNIWWHQQFFYDVIFPQGSNFFFFLQYIKSKIYHIKSILTEKKA